MMKVAQEDLGLDAKLLGMSKSPFFHSIYNFFKKAYFFWTYLLVVGMILYTHVQTQIYKDL